MEKKGHKFRIRKPILALSYIVLLKKDIFFGNFIFLHMFNTRAFQLSNNMPMLSYV